MGRLAQAEAVVATVGDAVGENVATRADLAEVRTEIAEVKAEVVQVRAELQSDIAQVRAELEGDIAEGKADLFALEARLYRHLRAMAAGIVGLTVSLTVALVKLTS
ncbi:MAG: hypothetical protein J4F42_03555 [Desulfurellaceae bacterium]|nr:hypothetical protein [Desulfurellaceae bacterium]